MPKVKSSRSAQDAEPTSISTTWKQTRKKWLKGRGVGLDDPHAMVRATHHRRISAVMGGFGVRLGFLSVSELVEQVGHQGCSGSVGMQLVVVE